MGLIKSIVPIVFNWLIPIKRKVHFWIEITREWKIKISVSINIRSKIGILLQQTYGGGGPGDEEACDESAWKGRSRQRWLISFN